MTRPTVNRGGTLVELRPRERLVLFRARDSFATSLNTLRLRYSLSSFELATQAEVVPSRLKRLLRGEALPSWDEAALFAWLFQVPISTLIRPLTLACDFLSGPAFAEGTESMPRSGCSQIDCARKAYRVQKLLSRHRRLLDISLAEWPALLPPTLADALANESAVMCVNSVVISECVCVVQQAVKEDPPGCAPRSLGENLDITLEATIGSIERLQALIHRHHLDDAATAQLASRVEVIQGIRGVLADVQSPLVALRAFGVADSVSARQARIEQLIELLPSLGIEAEHEDSEDVGNCLASLSPGDRSCATQMLEHVSISLSSVADMLRHLSSLAKPSTRTNAHAAPSGG